MAAESDLVESGFGVKILRGGTLGGTSVALTSQWFSLEATRAVSSPWQRASVAPPLSHLLLQTRAHLQVGVRG